MREPTLGDCDPAGDLFHVTSLASLPSIARRAYGPYEPCGFKPDHDDDEPWNPL